MNGRSDIVSFVHSKVEQDEASRHDSIRIADSIAKAEVEASEPSIEALLADQ